MRPSQDASAQSPTARIVRNANAFAATLSDAQKQRVQFNFDDDAQRVRWSNFPTSFVKRAGLSLGELTPAQRSAAMTLVSSALSKRGYDKVLEIMEADEVLKTNRVPGHRLLRGRSGARPGSWWLHC